MTGVTIIDVRFGVKEVMRKVEHVAFTEEDDGFIHMLYEVLANHTQKALDQANGRVEGQNCAANMLGINPVTLRGRIKKLKISYGRASHTK